ncbi:MAG TPA: hypothetical protein PKE31_16505 [Pseudomonadota bacterium]|jgi:hypothetical protein|nr:hypothetical protein [Pseudomonadota bacterium]
MTQKAWAFRLSSLLVLGLCLAMGCGKPVPPVPTGILVLRVSPRLSNVLIDDRPVLLPGGSEPSRLRLTLGEHRIEVRALSHLPSYRDVTIRAQSDTVLDIALHKDPDAEPDDATVKPFSPVPKF